MKNKKIITIGHQANNLGEIERYLLASVEGVEIDLRMTQDRIVIARHDRVITNGYGRSSWVDKMTFSELSDNSNEAVTTFEAVLKKIALWQKKERKTVLLDLDLKQPNTEEEVVRLLKKYKMEKVQVDGWDIFVLNKFEELIPKSKTQLTYNPDDKLDLAKISLFSLLLVIAVYTLKPFLYRLIRRKTANKDINIAGLHCRLLNKNIIHFLHQNKIQVFVWGATKERQFKQLIKLGVDGIKTNRPEILRQMINNKK